mmetsp:Transcript_9875/g.19306  ORF Transcript_9875/g.19306 Transcript_9875/m.19306 type:complete len:286 (-) Transcript_9875:235-1092(-)
MISSLRLLKRMFFVIGLFGALAMEFKGDSDLLTTLTDRGVADYARITTYFFPLCSLVTSIPVFSIIMRYNLIENKVCSTWTANFWSVLFPWLLSLLVYGGTTINYVLNWAGIITVGPLNFIVPIWIYLVATGVFPKIGLWRDAGYAGMTRPAHDVVADEGTTRADSAYDAVASSPDSEERLGNELKLVQCSDDRKKTVTFRSLTAHNQMESDAESPSLVLQESLLKPSERCSSVTDLQTGRTQYVALPAWTGRCGAYSLAGLIVFATLVATIYAIVATILSETHC